ncbi:2-C-methyl-D-erythritol 4-phosphate cytidylyltransferase [Polynucleobacter sp. TUM22923]|jgi:2-C-methyl-D-erythritol 4-phosphate cytidylyltransferase|uniref:2-C-methyl-D-erythritol 4-phosphate cytidylyltransferase n=1 Tax=Polynucleobacter sp. TUM22923 TaxID=3022126 RepID=UPI002574660C|nr:2-C-methyl-D-erythritol 4-phosphate cytidylyltransferase [Polynucleobacter sp. TUM22923]BDX21493.1 2-C-methyl-D-erythritol 4-phosphate cytidylyltransferase [Polynucleobacter sp. TUM22923]
MPTGIQSTPASPQCHALLPTAGSGSRLGGDLPKQFQVLAGKPMLSYALDAFSSTPEIASIWVGLSPAFIEDPILKSFSSMTKPTHFLPTGGLTRQETVMNTLAAMLQSGIPQNDWVLVHDAARPGIRPALIQNLIHSVTLAGEGGLLAMPLADTLKMVQAYSPEDGGPARVQKTISRDHLWQAQTPQMFGLQDLHDAIEAAMLINADMTDEASAMELAGTKPLLIHGETRNFKVTHPADWELIQAILKTS